MKRLALLLLFAAGCQSCEMWSTYAREHHCVEIERVPATCQMTNIVGFQDIGGVQVPMYTQMPYPCDDYVYRCDGGELVRR